MPLRSTQRRTPSVTRFGWLILLVAGSLLAGPATPIAPADAPVDGAAELTNPGFEQLGPNGLPIDWQPIGETVGVSEIAHSGQRSLRVWREAGQTDEVGFNRDWRAGSGERGTMLLARRGALAFWYRLESLAPDAEMVFQAIPMNDEPLEGTGSQRAMVSVPRDHAGDEQWHRAVLAYNFTDNPRVRWVHVSGRLSGPGEVLVDDVAWLPEAGPLPRIARARFVPDRDDRFGQGALVVTLHNAGDQPTGTLNVTLDPPAGLTVGPAQGAPDSLPPGAWANVVYAVSGERRDRVSVPLHLDVAGGESATFTAVAEPELRLTAVLTEPLLPQVGDTLTFTALVDNRGLALPEDLTMIATGTGFAEPAVIEVPLAPEPGQPTRYRGTWRMASEVAERHAVRVVVRERRSDVDDQVVELALRGSVPTAADYAPLVSGLEVAASPDGAVGRIVRDGQPVAVLPHLGRVIYRRPSATVATAPATVATAPATEAAEAPAEATTSEVQARNLSLLWVEGEPVGARAVETDADGGRWTFTLWTDRSRHESLYLRYDIECDRPRDLLAAYGPELLVPDRRGEALFPGLEWLTADEVSSDDLDIATDHPHRLRLAPHPNMVTLPLMAVDTEQGVVAMLWDARFEWLEGQARPQPIFAAPDRFDRHVNAARLGLMAPNVPAGLPPNTLRATEPMRLHADVPLHLAAHVYVDDTTHDVLDAVDAWFNEYRPQPPLPLAAGGVTEQLAQAAQSYLGPLWDEQQGGWNLFLLGPAVMNTMGLNPSYAYDLEQIARLLPQDHALQPDIAERLELFYRHGRSAPVTNDRGYYAGDPFGMGRYHLMSTGAVLASRAPDGGWGYEPPLLSEGVFAGQDYLELGEPGTQANGLMAARLRDVLRAARLLGDTGTYQAALPSLERLAQFDVPRAAQVWEVPVHTPDILAAAEACEAFLEAYQLSGDRRWLDEARQAARSGLPFVYVWNEPGKPWMRFGSIPVFGATWFQGSWFGRLVQWNGLRYAQALLQLYPFDRRADWGGLSWWDIAQGITVSATYQMSRDPEYFGLWPDALDTITEERAAWEFAPRQVLMVLFELLGRVDQPRTVVLLPGDLRVREVPPPDSDEPRVTVSALAEITDGQWRDDVLQLRFAQRAAPANVRATIAGVTEPTAVALDGQPLPRAPIGAGTQTPSWQYHDAGATVVLVLPATATAAVTLHGVAARRVDWQPTLMTTLDFSFDQDAQGWHAANDLLMLSVEDGVLHTTTTGGDPYLIRPGLRVDGDTVDTVVVRLRLSGTGAAYGQLYWTTAVSPAWAEDKVIHFEPPAGEWTEVRIPVGDHPMWRGQTITGLRLDPVNQAPPVEVAVDYVRGE